MKCAPRRVRMAWPESAAVLFAPTERSSAARKNMLRARIRGAASSLPRRARRLRRVLRQPSFLLERAAEQELDLGVQAAQLVRRPELEGVERPRIEPQQVGPALRHGRPLKW